MVFIQLPGKGEFDREPLNGLITTRAELEVLVTSFQDQLHKAVETSNLIPLSNFVKELGQTKLHGVLRCLERQDRIDAIDGLLPLIGKYHDTAVELVLQILNTSRGLVDLGVVVEGVGAERLKAPVTRNGTPFFGEIVVLSQAGLELKGSEFLPDTIPTDYEQQLEQLDTLESILTHNLAVIETAADGELLPFPLAVNAKLLREAFIEQKIQVQYGNTFDGPNLAEVLSCWCDRIRIHTRTGLGVYDHEDLRLTADEMQQICSATEKFPAAVLLFRGIAMRIDFKENDSENSGALGGFNLGRVLIFEAVRDTTAGTEEQIANRTEYATVHELAHASHTFGLEDFKKLSCWIAVRNGRAVHPRTGDVVTIAPDDLQPGDTVTISNEEYIVADYREPEKFSFPLGIEFRNPDVPIACAWLYRKDSHFVSEYATVEPLEDYAESLSSYLLNPNVLRERAPEKFVLMNYLYGI